MNCVNCSVRPNAHNGWMAELESQTTGPYLDRDMALRIAIIDAQMIRRSGRRARITVYDATREIRAEYCLSDQCACKEADVVEMPK
jgi:hypothetical protein